MLLATSAIFFLKGITVITVITETPGLGAAAGLPGPHRASQPPKASQTFKPALSNFPLSYCLSPCTSFYITILGLKIFVNSDYLTSLYILSEAIRNCFL